MTAQKPGEFLETQDKLSTYFSTLKKANKTIFLITNSPFELVNAGMSFMMGKEWRDIFDVIIVQAWISFHGIF